jgi:hypothetical protein
MNLASFIITGLMSFFKLIAFLPERNAVLAHFAGNEKISPGEQRKIDALPAGSMLQIGVTSLWTDPGINDNKVPLKNITVQ